MKTPFATYGLTLAAVLLALGCRWLLDPLLGNSFPFPTFFGAVFVASWLGGPRPALLATVLGLVLSIYFFVPPRFSFGLPGEADLIGLIMYVMVSLAIAVFGVSQRRLRQAERTSRQFERELPTLRILLKEIPCRSQNYVILRSLLLD